MERDRSRAEDLGRLARRFERIAQEAVSASLCHTHLLRDADAKFDRAHRLGELETVLRALLGAVRRMAVPVGEDAPPRVLPMHALVTAALAEVGLPAHTDVGVRVELPTLEVAAREVPVVRALTELMQNAANHDPGGHLRIAARGVDGGGVVVEVTDGGPGWPPHIRSVADVVAGRSGMGLSVVEDVVEGHGGAVELFAAAGGGAGVRSPFSAGSGGRAVRVALRIGNDLLRRALADVLAAAGHDVERNATPATHADLFVVSEPALLRAPSRAPTLVLRLAPGAAADATPVEARLPRAARRGRGHVGAAARPGRARRGARGGRRSSARRARPRGDQPRPRARRVAARGPVDGRRTMGEHRRARHGHRHRARGVVGDRAAELRPGPRRARERSAEGRRPRGPRSAVWWTGALGQRVVGLLAGPGDEADIAAGNLRTLAELGRTLSVLAHELRNPIASLAGALDMLAASDSPEDQAEVIHLARGRLLGMRALLDDVLRYARPFRGEPTIVDVVAVVESAEAAVRADPRYLRCRFEHEVGADVLHVRAHEEPLRQALVNLLINAAEAMAGQGRVQTDVVAEGAWAVLRVRDEGPGIAAEHHERVFEPFWTTKLTGTGLGLAHVRRVAEAAAVVRASSPNRAGRVFASTSSSSSDGRRAVLGTSVGRGRRRHVVGARRDAPREGTSLRHETLRSRRGVCYHPLPCRGVPPRFPGDIMAKARRTTHRSSTGKKLYAVRSTDGSFKDIQTFERAHRADLRKKSKPETAAAAKKAAKAPAKKVVKKRVAKKKAM